MRYKEHTIRKVEAQAAKLQSLQRAIQMKTMSAQEAINFIETVVKELKLVSERLELEPNE
jgi:hypothetical protein